RREKSFLLLRFNANIGPGIPLLECGFGHILTALGRRHSRRSVSPNRIVCYGCSRPRNTLRLRYQIGDNLLRATVAHNIACPVGKPLGRNPEMMIAALDTI